MKVYWGSFVKHVGHHRLMPSAINSRINKDCYPVEGVV